MATFAERLDVLTAESARLDRYVRSLSPEALGRPSACAEWQIQDVVAHLVGVAEFYAGTVVRGLAGEIAPPPGRAPAGASTGATAAEGIAQRSIAARQHLGDHGLQHWEHHACRAFVAEGFCKFPPRSAHLCCFRAVPGPSPLTENSERLISAWAACRAGPTWPPSLRIPKSKSPRFAMLTPHSWQPPTSDIRARRPLLTIAK